MEFKKLLSAVALTSSLFLAGCGYSQPVSTTKSYTTSYDPEDYDLNIDYDLTFATDNPKNAVEIARTTAKDYKGRVVLYNASENMANLIVEIPSEQALDFKAKIEDQEELVNYNADGSEVYVAEDLLDEEDEEDDLIKCRSGDEKEVKEDKPVRTSRFDLEYKIRARTANFNHLKYTVTHIFDIFINFIIILLDLILVLSPYILVGLLIWFFIRHNKKKKQEQKEMAKYVELDDRYNDKKE